MSGSVNNRLVELNIITSQICFEQQIAVFFGESRRVFVNIIREHESRSQICKRINY